ncbi:hypothetical protein K458DRAFT_357901 [Lentithecium fluviatile CBS 122367]|uniref:Kinetochore protein fta4 n=1 Tax=Lentithecium fluviatile CBS 122367 TaxID=1168545 RepID=A0A6G1JFC0_9PLEO|nr:hypothetical protein K458DRAFT_357901 [Lentithecium fluviatile CBS 122367]
MSRHEPSIVQKQQTVVEQKQQFLQSRKHFLSRGITPSEKLKQIAQDGGVALSELKGALDKVNRDLKQHSRKVYSRQMTEHIVEQIDNFYWTSGAREVDADDAIDTATDMIDDAHTVYQSDDLTRDECIAKLRPRWDTSAGPPSSSENPNEVDQDDYFDALTRLQDLSAKRLTLQQKLNTYRTLLSLLEPYSKPKENIQPNLVWKDALLASELAKTRTLAIRVIGRAEEKFGDMLVPETAEEDEDVEMGSDEGKAKVDKVLASW